MKICKINGCNEKHYAKGLCKYHYTKQWREDNKEHCLAHRRKNKEKISVRRKKWQAKNREHILQQNKKYRQDHKEYRAEYNKQYQQKNKQKGIKKAERYRKAHPDLVKKSQKKYKQKHKEKIAKFMKQYMKQYYHTVNGKAVIKAIRHNRRALTKDLTGETIQQVYEANIAKYGVLTCYLCGKPIIDNDDSLEHSTPVTRQGSNNYENLGIAHKKCNSRKGTMTLIEWFNNKTEGKQWKRKTK